MSELESEASPHGSMPEGFRRYWSKGGEGGDRIRWGAGGDFDRCVVAFHELDATHPHAVPPERIDGVCGNLHQLNTGMSTSEHAKLLGGRDTHGKSSAKTVLAHRTP